MATHSHISNPCKICAYPLTGKDAMDFLEKQKEPSIMASEPHIIGGATWKDFDNDECPECGDSLEIETTCELINMGNDGDLVRCLSCGWLGQLTVDEDGSSYVHD